MNRPVPSPRHKTILPPLLASVIALAGLLLPCPVSLAQTTDTWTDSTGNGLWSDGANWDMAEPGINPDVILPAPFPSANTTITLDAGETAGTLTISDDYTLSGGDLMIANRGVTVDTGVFATINSTLMNGLRKFGLGSLAVHDISGLVGNITVDDGTLIIADTAGVPAGLTSFLMEDGATIVNGTAMSLDWTGNTYFSGASSIGAGGEMKFDNFQGSAPSIFNSTEVTGSISVTSLGGTGNLLLSVSDGFVSRVEDGLGVVLQGTGMSMLNISIIQGNATVDLAADDLLNSSITFFDSGVLNFNGHTDEIGTVTLNNSAVLDLGGGMATTGNVTLNGNALFDLETGTANTGSFTINDNGVLNLGGGTANTERVIVAGDGIFQIGGGMATTGNVTLNGNGMFQIDGGMATTGNVTLNGNGLFDLATGTANTGSFTIYDNGVLNLGGGNATTGTISLNDNGVPGSGTIDFDGGTLNVLGSFFLPDPDAVIDLEGGSLSVSDNFGTLSCCNIASGAVNIGSGSLDIGGEIKRFGGTLDLTTGSLEIEDGSISTGTTINTGSAGTVRFVDDTFDFNSPNPTGAAGTSITGGGTINHDGDASWYVYNLAPEIDLLIEARITGNGTTADGELAFDAYYGNGTVLLTNPDNDFNLRIDSGIVLLDVAGAEGTSEITLNGGRIGANTGANIILDKDLKVTYGATWVGGSGFAGAGNLTVTGSMDNTDEDRLIQLSNSGMVTILGAMGNFVSDTNRSFNFNGTGDLTIGGAVDNEIDLSIGWYSTGILTLAKDAGKMSVGGDLTIVRSALELDGDEQIGGTLTLLDAAFDDGGGKLTTGGLAIEQSAVVSVSGTLDIWGGWCWANWTRV